MPQCTSLILEKPIIYNWVRIHLPCKDRKIYYFSAILSGFSNVISKQRKYKNLSIYYEYVCNYRIIQTACKCTQQLSIYHHKKSIKLIYCLPYKQSRTLSRLAKGSVHKNPSVPIFNHVRMQMVDVLKIALFTHKWIPNLV